jgi:hypothetical protein
MFVQPSGKLDITTDGVEGLADGSDAIPALRAMLQRGSFAQALEAGLGI